MTNLILLIIFVLIILFMIIGGIWCYFQEKKNFNNGVCPHCGTPLTHFDDDSQGGQGWHCTNCNHIVWISWFKR